MYYFGFAIVLVSFRNENMLSTFFDKILFHITWSKLLYKSELSKWFDFKCQKTWISIRAAESSISGQCNIVSVRRRIFFLIYINGSNARASEFRQIYDSNVSFAKIPRRSTNLAYPFGSLSSRLSMRPIFPGYCVSYTLMLS